MPSVQTILSPMMLQLLAIDDKVVVVIDVLRATSSICVAFAHGASRIIPVATPAESMGYKQQGFIAAAERDGKPVEGFDIGNSPFSYMSPEMKGASIAITTTNGTQAIHLSKNAAKVVIGSFLNKKALVSYLIKQQKDVVLLCSGWKNHFNLEDTLFAGALALELTIAFRLSDDASIAAIDLYNYAKTDLHAYVQKSSHAHRFITLGIEEDIRFCLQQDIYDIIPELEDDFLIPARI